MNKILTYLEQLELSDIEAKLYLTLLETGPINVRALAERIEIKRTTAYLYIDQLIEKGLIVKIIKGNNKLLAANDPKDSLEYLVKKKLQTAQTIQAQFPTILQTIHTSLPEIKGVGEAEIKYYKGRNGVMKIYEEALQAEELRSYVDISKIAEVFPENFQLFNNAFKKNPNMKMFEIVESSPQARKYIEFSKTKENYFQKLLPEDMRLTAQDILIYNDRVAIIHLDKLYAIILRNEELYNNFKMLFNFTWKMIP